MKRVATLGFFDGVHRGHQYLLQQLCEVTGEGGTSIVLTFAKHPQRVLGRKDPPPLLTTADEKTRLMKSLCHIEQIEVLDFDQRMAALTAEDFMNHYLHSTFGITHLLVGYDHHFGRPRWGESIENYREYGKEIGIEVIAAKQLPEIKISSSRIRKLIVAGEIDEANNLLGHTFMLEGKVVKGQGIGKKLGIPTANLSVNDPQKMIPAHGVYVTTVKFDGKFHPAVTNIGHCPTLKKVEKTSVESHLLEENFPSLYDKEVEVYFHKRIRDEKDFDNADALLEQIHTDAEIAKELHREIHFSAEDAL